MESESGAPHRPKGWNGMSCALMLGRGDGQLKGKCHADQQGAPGRRNRSLPCRVLNHYDLRPKDHYDLRSNDELNRIVIDNCRARSPMSGQARP